MSKENIAENRYFQQESPENQPAPEAQVSNELANAIQNLIERLKTKDPIN